MYVRVIGDTANYTTLTDLRLSFPNVSFPAVISDEDAAQFDVYPCEEVPAPTSDYTKNIAMGDPVKINGAWFQTWVVTDASAEEISHRLANQWVIIRAERNEKLSDCDWTQLPDAPVNKETWATYRQELRDVTIQPNPFDIIWPVKPT